MNDALTILYNILIVSCQCVVVYFFLFFKYPSKALFLNYIKEYLPKPARLEEAEQQAENVNNNAGEAKFNFSYVECLLLSFHAITKFSQEFLTGDENKERLKDFRIRLQYFGKGTQNYIKELRNLLAKSDPSSRNEQVI